MSTTFIKDLVIESIQNRYAVYERPASGKSGIAMDNYLPIKFINQLKNRNVTMQIPKTAVALSEYTSSIFKVPVISRLEFAKLLGYTEKELKDIFINAKKMQHDITLLGYGGSNMNFLYWISQLSEELNIVNIFKKISIYEYDSLEIHNTLRFPMNVLNQAYTDRIAPELNSISLTLEKYRYEQHIKKINLIDKQRYDRLSSSVMSTYDSKFYVKYSRYNSCRTVYIGAPDIQTRQQMYESGLDDMCLITNTHGSKDCSIHINPQQDIELQVESYGMIRLGAFFANQLKMSIEILRLLSKSQSELAELDSEEYLNYEYKEDSVKSKAKRSYYIETEHSGLVHEGE